MNGHCWYYLFDQGQVSPFRSASETTCSWPSQNDQLASLSQSCWVSLLESSSFSWAACCECSRFLDVLGLNMFAINAGSYWLCLKYPSIDSFLFFFFGFTFLTLNRLAIYLNRRYQSIYSQGAGTKDALSSEKLRKLNVVSPIRRLDQWWPGVKDTLGLQGGVDNNHFVWYACPYL